MSTVKTTTLSNLAGDKTIPVDTVVQGSAKAWVNFNGTGTVAIRASFNVSSITDNGTGDYTVNFTTAMTDANYCVSGLSNASGFRTVDDVTPRTASLVRVYTFNSATQSNADVSAISLSIFR